MSQEMSKDTYKYSKLLAFKYLANVAREYNIPLLSSRSFEHILFGTGQNYHF